MRASRRATPASPRSNVGVLADSTNRLVNEQGKPAAEDLRKAIASVQQAADNLNAMIADARPGVQNFSKSTLPEANHLVRDLRELSQSLSGFSDRAQPERHRRRARAREAARLQAEETQMKLRVAHCCPIALAAALGGCSLGGLLGGGGKAAGDPADADARGAPSPAQIAAHAPMPARR